MPKATGEYALPVSAFFGVVKPSGPSSMAVINDLKNLVARSKIFVAEDQLEKSKGKKISKRGKNDVKIGQGGTLDPLADGVLVVGVGKATKKLNQFLECVKEYRTTCLLGCETDSYDSEGARVRTAPWKHITKEMVESTLEKFRGEIQQVPPIFSALKMDGRPLYEYARKGIPLPRPIEARKTTVHSLELVEWKDTHEYRWPSKSLSSEEKTALKTATGSNELEDAPEEEGIPPVFVLTMRVSSGTYVRSIVHDLAHALGSAGHVVTLSRTRQGRFALTETEEGDRRCLPWEVFEKAADEQAGEDGWRPWEREILANMETLDNA
ncbi:Dihydrodipicolinate synthetase [Mycena indigotica]|uniref:tRNA pseudouridine(55) synthase n=1 Tax=Mycena indigotica TaxID=2126181 RepID=A0A8H6SAQ6_9AGAR|nr:Dihydrodipicolinate synthetase [Mycena indigotica]KAF7294867.1 Dihydrodipicolinate synthetase [Mycena indigotica]